jgi:alkaline phosphatase D
MTSRRDALKSAVLLPLAGLPTGARAAPAISGTPLAGHFTVDTARLWMQATEESSATLRYWPAAATEADARSVSIPLPKAAGSCAIADIAGLAPGSAYRYRVTLESGAAAAGCFRTVPASAARPGDFRVYLGSCAYTETYTRGGNAYGANHQIFDAIATRMAEDGLPHFMLWLGDNLYLRGPSASFGAPAEYSTAAHMELRYRSVRAMLQLRRLFAATHHYAIWDDHDYGANNSDKTFALKDDSLRLFRAYWPNPPMGSQELPGTWCSFSHQDAEFFLLDNRFHRDAEKAAPDPAKAMFGRAQMDWLKRGLAASRATFKLVAGGTQFLSDGANGEESGWHSYPGERDEFLAFLEKERVTGVVLLSGDRHNTQVFRHALGARQLHEFSCSPLTSKVIPLSKTDLANPRLVRECAVETQNYGTLEFSGEGRARTLTARCFDAESRPLWTRVLATAGRS